MNRRKTVAAAGLALGLTLGPANPARAAVVWFPFQDIPIPTTYEGVSVDLESGAFSQALEGLPGGDANFFFGGMVIGNDADINAAAPTWQPLRSGPQNTDPVSLLTAGVDSVGPASEFLGTGFGASGDPETHFPPAVAGTPVYLGFSLELDGGSVAFGWLRATLEENTTAGVIHEWAYEDTGASILVGAVPEPAHLALALAALAGACTAARRRRRGRGRGGCAAV